MSSLFNSINFFKWGHGSHAICVYFHIVLFYVNVSLNGQKSYDDHFY